MAAARNATPVSVEKARVTAGLEKYRTLGGWVERPDNPQPPLEGDVGADVVIVGAGYVGLNTALELARLGMKVVVLEREFPGFGASGRNAGYLAGAMGIEYELFLKRVGREKAKQIVEYYEEGVRYVEGKLSEYGIDCDYYQTGLIRAGVHPSQEEKVRESMKVLGELGFQSEFLDDAGMRARGIPPAYLFGNYVSRGGTLDPGKYVMGLRRAALEAGVKIYENTALLSYTEGPIVKVHTAQGSASAPFVVLATNAYTPQIGVLEDKVMPMRISAMETEPLSPAQLAALGWPRREGIVTAHWTMESARLTARNSLLITTKRLHYVYGSKTPNVRDDDAYRELMVALRDRFPALKDLSIRAFWSGYVSIAGDALPVVGETGAQQNIFYAAGCSGHGVGTQSLTGHLIAERIRGVEHPLLAALRHKTPSTLPEPLRWCFVNGLLGITNMLDDKVNSKARTADAGSAKR
ncbi:FAD-binding oxidoreductase [Paraburkholderia sediminicola]